MLRGSNTLKLGPHFGAIPHALRVEYPQLGPSLRSYPACSEGRIPSTWTLTSELSRMLRGSNTLKLGPHFGAIPHALRVEYPQLGPSLRSYPACSEGRIPSTWTLTSELSRMLRGSNTLKLDPHFGAIPHAPRVEYPQVGHSLRRYPACSEGRIPSTWTLTLELSRMLRGSNTLKLDTHFGGIPHAPRVEYPQLGPSLWSYPACSEGRIPSS